MNALRERDGVPLSEQIRRGLRMYLESKGVIKKWRCFGCDTIVTLE